MDKFIYYYDVKQDAYIIKDYSITQGMRIIGKSVFLYHNTLVLNADQLKDNLQDCIDAIYTKKPILYHKQDINPLWHNGNVYETYSKRV